MERLTPIVRAAALEALGRAVVRVDPMAELPDDMVGLTESTLSGLLNVGWEGGNGLREYRLPLRCALLLFSANDSPRVMTLVSDIPLSHSPLLSLH